MDLIFNLKEEELNFTDSKKDVLKFLKIIGVDSRFISYTSNKIYINNLRFSKLSKAKEKTFKKQYPEIDVVRSSLFQKICARSSKVLSRDLKPGDTVLLLKKDNSINNLLTIVLEPYTRKYGVKLINKGEANLKVSSEFLDKEVNTVLSCIFEGKGIDFRKKDGVLYPFINIPKEWLNSFLEMENFDLIKEEKFSSSSEILADSFMEFLSNIVPQYRENVLVSKEYLNENSKAKQ